MSRELGKAIRLPCGRWSCPKCGRKLARKWAKRVRGVSVERFITLTIDPKGFGNSQEAEKALYAMLTRFVKRVRRRFGKFEYLAVVEWTKKGWPHLHLVARGTFMPQSWISENWEACGGGRIVDIRRVRDPLHVYRYIMKYLLKQAGREAPKGFRRVRTSRAFFEELASPPKKAKGDWLLATVPLERLAESLATEGYVVQVRGDSLEFHRPGPDRGPLGPGG